jgi:hypothetical protein
VYVLAAASRNDDPIIAQVVQTARPAALAFGMFAAIAAYVCWRAVANRRPVLAVCSLAVAWFVGLSLLFATVGHVGAILSGKELAAQIPPSLAASAPLFSVQTYDQTFPFYLRRTMTLVDARGELDYGLQHEPHKGISDVSVFEQRWRELPQGVAIMSHRSHAELAARGLPMRVLGKDRRRVAVSRR